MKDNPKVYVKRETLKEYCDRKLKEREKLMEEREKVVKEFVGTVGKKRKDVGREYKSGLEFKETRRKRQNKSKSRWYKLIDKETKR